MAHVLAPSPDFLGLDVAFLASDKPRTVGAVRASAEPLRAPLTGHLPVSLEPSRSIGGVGGYATVDDYYETIHVRPALIDVGRLTASIRREVEVWNAYRENERTLERIDVTAGDGILVGGPDLPVTLPLLGSVVFTVDVTPEGPATIDARYDLVFGAEERDPRWRVLGTRIIEWSIAPNWAGGFDETYAFKTEVLEAFDGSEQRIALRHRPRRTFAFEPLVSGERDRRMRRLLSTWQNRTFAMADWPRGVRTDGVPQGGQSVRLHDDIPGLVPAGLLVLRHQDTSQVIEVDEVDEVDGDTVRLTSPVLQAFPPGTRAYRGLTVHAESELSARRITSQVGRLSAAFRELHVAESLSVPAAEETWRGLEVLTRKPNWREQPDLTHAWDVAWIDRGRGPFDFRTPHDAPKDVRQFHFTLEGREEVDALRDVFLRAKGRRGELFVPTWDEDVQYSGASPLPENNTQLPVADRDDMARMGTERVYRNVCVVLTDGTRLYRHVVGGSEGPQGTVLLLDTGWPRTIDPWEVRAVHWMPKCRMASDELTIRWLTDGVAEATLAFQVLTDVLEGDL